MPAHGPEGEETLPLFSEDALVGQDRARAIYEPTKAAVLARLRQAAWDHWQETGRPVSANDIRYVLKQIGYTGDLRILGATFDKQHWKPVGRTSTDTARAAQFGVTRQGILTYVPR